MKGFLKSVSILLIVLASLVGCSTGCFATTQGSTRYIGSPENVTHVMDSTVALMIRNPLTGEQQIGCSGFFVSPTRIVTAEHCVAVHELTVTISPEGEPSIGMHSTPPTEGEEIRYVTHSDWVAWTHQNHTSVPNPVSHVAKVSVWDTDADVAIITVENPTVNASHDWFQVRTSELRIGEPVLTVGQPMLFRWAVSEGIVSFVQLISDPEVNRVMIGATAPIYPGNSGCPLLDAYGRVIGVADMIAYRQPTLGLYSPAQNIETLLARIPQGH